MNHINRRVGEATLGVNIETSVSSSKNSLKKVLQDMKDDTKEVTNTVNDELKRQMTIIEKRNKVGITTNKQYAKEVDAVIEKYKDQLKMEHELKKAIEERQRAAEAEKNKTPFQKAIDKLKGKEDKKEDKKDDKKDVKDDVLSGLKGIDAIVLNQSLELARKIKDIIVGVVKFAVKMYSEAFNQLRELENMERRFSAVYGDNELEMQEWVDTFSSKMKQSRLDMTDRATSLTDILVGYNVDRKEALKMTREMMEFAVDLAAFQGRELDDVIDRLQRGIVARQPRALANLGITLNQHTLDAKALEMYEQTFNELQQSAQIEVSFELAKDQSPNVHGFAEKNLDSMEALSNETKRVEEEFLVAFSTNMKDAIIEFGKAYLHVIESLGDENNIFFGTLSKLVSKLGELTKEARFKSLDEQGEYKQSLGSRIDDMKSRGRIFMTNDEIKEFEKDGYVMADSFDKGVKRYAASGKKFMTKDMIFDKRAVKEASVEFRNLVKNNDFTDDEKINLGVEINKDDVKDVKQEVNDLFSQYDTKSIFKSFSKVSMKDSVDALNDLTDIEELLSEIEGMKKGEALEFLGEMMDEDKYKPALEAIEFIYDTISEKHFTGKFIELDDIADINDVKMAEERLKPIIKQVKEIKTLQEEFDGKIKYERVEGGKKPFEATYEGLDVYDRDELDNQTEGILKMEKALTQLQYAGIPFNLTVEQSIELFEHMSSIREEEINRVNETVSEEERLNDVLSRQNETVEKSIDQMKEKSDLFYEELDDKESEIAYIEHLVEMMETLLEVKDRSAEQNQLLTQTGKELNDLTGQQIVVFNENGVATRLVGEELKILQDTIAETRNEALDSIDIHIRTIRSEIDLGAVNEEIEAVKSRMEDIRKKQMGATSVSEIEALEEAYQQEARTLDMLTEKVNSYAEANRKAQREQEDMARRKKMELHNIEKREAENQVKEQERLEREARQSRERARREQEKADREAKQAREREAREAERRAREAEQALRNKVREELEIINHRQTMEIATSQQTLNALKKHMNNFTSYYKDNLSEYRTQLEAVKRLSDEIKQDKQDKDLDVLTQAKDRLVDKLSSDKDRIQKSHDITMNAIDKEHNKRIENIEKTFQKQRDEINKLSRDRRMADLDEKIAAFEGSQTKEGQETYLRALEERAQLKLDEAEEIKNETIRQEQEKHDEIVKSMERENEIQLANIERQEEAINKVFENMSNKIKGITDEMMEESARAIEISMGQLTGKTASFLSSFEGTFERAISTTNTLDKAIREVEESMGVHDGYGLFNQLSVQKKNRAYTTDEDGGVVINIENINGLSKEEAKGVADEIGKQLYDKKKFGRI